ncbi:MAG: M13 family metallopeptidase [Acidobacteria bacterium]|nr:M13 family metallopeptidase [Acidobacteriota bacterium]
MFVFVVLPLAFLFATIHALVMPVAAQTVEVPPPVPGFDPKAMDPTVSPCTDFFQYSCGGWIKSNPIPPDRSSWSRGGQLDERNQTILHQILEEAARNPDPPDQDTKKIADYYASCMDEAGIEAKGARPFEQEFQRIDALKMKEDLVQAMARLHTLAITAGFRFGSDQDFKDAASVIASVDQGGLSLPDRDYYLNADERSVTLRAQFVEHVQKMFELLGEPPAKAAAGASAVMELETAMAKVSMDRVLRRDPENIYHKLMIAELQALTPSFPWKVYLADVKAPPFQTAIVASPDLMTGFDALVGSTGLEKWKAYLRWHVLHSQADLLASAFVNENFRFFGKTLTGAQELQARWKRCTTFTDDDLGEALGKVYVQRTFGAEGKERTLQMVRDIEKALERDIQALDWMTEATKKQALVKLHAVANKIGYPDRWRDYGALRIVRGDAIGNSLRSNEFAFRRELNKIGKPVDRGEWFMSPPTVNAYYYPLTNDINFPAGILQPPYFDKSLDDAVNYGAVGAVIGHELTHGFDDQGRKFDATGNLADWWTPKDARAFEERAACIVEKYAQFTVVDDVKVNGKLTLGENVADNGGLRLSFMALMDRLAGKEKKPIDTFTPEQRFFLGFGQVWCGERTEQRWRMLATIDPHSPYKWRVNGVVSNMPEFQKAFGCKPDDPMTREKLCRVW